MQANAKPMRQFGDQSLAESRPDDFYSNEAESTALKRQVDVTTRLSVIVPCFNEQNTVVALLTQLRAALPSSQIVFVDDGSTDQSLNLVTLVAADVCVEIAKISENRGKGAAVRLGLEHVTREFTIIQDADLEYDPNDIRALLRCAIEDPQVVVYGSRYLRTGRRPNGALGNYVAVKILSAVIAMGVTGLAL